MKNIAYCIFQLKNYITDKKLDYRFTGISSV